MRKTFCIFLPLVLGLFASANSGYAQPKAKPKIVRCPDDAPTVGWYRNYSYGFSLTIPAGLKGYWNSVPCVKDENQCTCLNDHGLHIPISESAYLEVSANPWMAETRQENIDNAYRFRLEGHKEKAEEVETLSRTAVRLNRIPAIRLKLRYTDTKTKVRMIEERLICVPMDTGRYVQGSTGYDYTLVNGYVFMEHGEHTGALAGRMLRSN